MAELLMRRWRLVVLRVSLDLAGSEPTVLAEVVTFPDGEQTVAWSERFAPAAFGMATRERGFTAPLLRVPDDLVGGVLETVADRVGPDAGLWLHLEEPRGYLGAVPWEAAIASAMEGPVLRLPNRLPVSVPTRRAYRLAIVASAAEPDRIVPHVLGMLLALADGLHQPLDLELFADVGVHDSLAGELAEVPVSGEVVVHDPATAVGLAERRWHVAAARKGRTGPTRRPGPAEVWTAWVATAGRSRGIDALHLVGDGVLDGDRGMFALASQPLEPVDRSTVAYLHADEVRALADRAGAEILVVDSAPGDPSELASRLLADAVGVNRPGPTVFGAAHLDPNGNALAAAHAFLAAPPGEEPVPTDPALFAYLQPERVAAAVVEEDSQTFMAYKAAPTGWMPVLAESEDDEVQGLPWVATAQRFIDTEVADLVLDARATTTTQSVTKSAYDDGRQRALSELQDLIQRHARPS